MDPRWLTGGMLAYAGVMAIEWFRMYVVYIPATAVVAPISFLTVVGIIATLRGALVKRETKPSTQALLMAAGFILGILGAWALFVSAIEHEHTVDVCGYSRVVADPNAGWACPQVLSSYLVQWPLVASLFIPIVLFFVVPFLASREELRQLDRSSQEDGLPALSIFRLNSLCYPIACKNKRGSARGSWDPAHRYVAS